MADDEEYSRCSRSAGKWRCKERASIGKAYCEKHHLYTVERGLKRSMEMEGENGGGVEVGSQRKKRKREGSEDKSGIVVVDKEQKVSDHVGFGDQGVHDWFSVGNSDVLGWFDDVGGGNVGESFQLWQNEATACGNNGRGQGLGGEGFHGSFGGECSGNEVLGLDGKVFQVWDGEGIQLDESSLGASENGAVGLGDQGAPGLFGQVSAANVGNVGVGSSGEGIQGVFGEVNGKNGDITLSGESMEGLFGECKNGGMFVSGEGVQCWCGEAGCASIDGKGIQGLFGETACGNGGERIESGCHENGGGDDEKTKKEIADVEAVGIEGSIEFGGNNKVGGEVFPVRRKQGRAKGSAQKKKDPQGEVNHGVGGDNMISNGRIVKEMCSEATGINGDGNENKQILGDGECIEGLVASEIVRPKAKRGRPKGSGKKQKDAAREEKQSLPGEGSVASEIVRPKGKRGRPKGSGKKQKDAAPEEKQSLPGEGSVASEILRPKGKRGRPKGSGKKQKDAAPEEKQSLSGDFLGNNDAGIESVTPAALKSERTTLAGAEDRAIPGEGTGANGKANSRSKGSKKQEENLADDNREMPGETKGTTDSGNRMESETGGTGIITPNRRDRLQGSKNNKQENHASGEAKVGVDGGDWTSSPVVLWDLRIALLGEEEDGGGHELPSGIVGYNGSCDNKARLTGCANDMIACLGETDGAMADENFGSSSGLNDKRKPKHKRVQLEDSENKQKYLPGDSHQFPGAIMGTNEGADNLFRLTGLENGTGAPFDGDGALCSDATNGGGERNATIKEITRPRLGRPKSSKKKPKYPARDCQELPSDIVARNGDADNIIWQVVLGNRIAAPLYEEDRLLSIGITGHSREGNGIRKPRPRGRPKGGSVKKKNLAGCQQELPAEVMNGNDCKDAVSLMGSEKRVIALLGEEGLVLPGEATGHSGGANDNIKSRRGRPKGTRNKKKNLAGGNQELLGEVMHGNDGKDAVSLVGSENRVIALLGEEGLVLPGEATAHSRGANVNIKRRGRPKGSRNKKKILAGGNRELHIKSGRGRPKGSRNKKKNLAGGNRELLGEVMHGNDGKDAVSLIGSENRVIALLGEEGLFLPGEATGHSGGANDNIKSRRGRPKGSQNKKKNHAGGNQELLGEVLHGNDGENAVRSMGLGNVMTTLFGEKDRALTGEATGHSEDGEIPKRKPVRPKGSKSKKTLAGGNQGLPGETMHGNDAGEKTPRPTSIKNGTVAPLGEEVKLMSGEVNGVSGDGNEIMKTNVKHIKKKNLAGDGSEEILCKIKSNSDGEDSIIWLEGSESESLTLKGEEDKNMPTEAAGGNEAGNANPRSKIRCGRPKALKMKKLSITSKEEGRHNVEFMGKDDGESKRSKDKQVRQKVLKRKRTILLAKSFDSILKQKSGMKKERGDNLGKDRDTLVDLRGHSSDIKKRPRGRPRMQNLSETLTLLVSSSKFMFHKLFEMDLLTTKHLATRKLLYESVA
ncbi:unnamed protein product [Dovyalis caffra]|uniref:WRC domain-containing protein n=1 Tax=Dovyalis caffra TaxID=77055 RepID=A0AAV1QRL5_9ROSI|nr:unnamed protein product [Dovyalis caffra]